jgi:hypothetical protein
LYEFAVLGSPSDAQIVELETIVKKAVVQFGLRFGHEISWLVRPATFNPDPKKAAVAAFFGGRTAHPDIENLLRKAVPVLPVVSDISKVSQEIPEVLRSLNCLDYNSGGAQRVATAMLECTGLLTRQRRVFLSYRREEARQAALQLFDALSSRLFDVFLDTHGIAPAEDFQARLWHCLCDSDVLVMLDTPSYFNSRWTSAEFGRALAKGISVLRVGWPNTQQSKRTATASQVTLLPNEIDADTGKLTSDSIERICLQLETARSESYAVRYVNLVSNLRNEVERINGRVIGIGVHKAVHVQLSDGREVVVYPTIGVPTSITLHDAMTNSPNNSVAVVYDHIGLHVRWLEHLEWLGTHIHAARWVKTSEVAWKFADWEA